LTFGLHNNLNPTLKNLGWATQSQNQKQEQNKSKDNNAQGELPNVRGVASTLTGLLANAPVIPQK
jgi:hypothetical protein